MQYKFTEHRMTKTDITVNMLKISALTMTMGLLVFCGKPQEAEVPEGRIIPMKEYSVNNAREWGEIADEHEPMLRKSVDNGKPALLIELPKLKTDYSHYIEVMGILDSEGNQLASTGIERTNRPLNYGYVDAGVLPWSGTIKIFAKCNLHDVWVNEINISDVR